MFARLCAFTAILTAGMMAASSPAWAANASHPATYTGTVAVGGTIEFDVSADGLSVTRFKIADVPTTCGTITSELTGSVAIANDGFSHPTGTLVFSGSFPAVQQAQGTLQVKLVGFPSCTSSVMNWTATTTAPPPAPPPDTTAPTPALSGSTTQRAGKTVALTVGCNEACTISASGTVSVPGAAKSYKLGAVTTQVAAGAKAKLNLKLSSSAQKAIKKALKKHRKVTAKITVRVRDAAGNTSTATRSIRLK